MKAYKLLVARVINGEQHAAQGSTVYRCNKPDYGCSSDDTRHTGVEHVSMTLRDDGDYPFFTVPVDHLEDIPT